MIPSFFVENIQIRNRDLLALQLEILPPVLWRICQEYALDFIQTKWRVSLLDERTCPLMPFFMGEHLLLVPTRVGFVMSTTFFVERRLFSSPTNVLAWETIYPAECFGLNMKDVKYDCPCVCSDCSDPIRHGVHLFVHKTALLAITAISHRRRRQKINGQ
jgi:hypothetical protein